MEGSTRIMGHIVASRELAVGGTQSVGEKPSVLSLRFDSVRLGGSSKPISVYLRAPSPVVSIALMPAPIATWMVRTPSADQVGRRRYVCYENG
jgi:hypothetical protein